jgi:hypothetical protein
MISKNSLYIKHNPLVNHEPEIQGIITHIDNEEMYCIENYDLMAPFFMSIVSSCDLWMYISSKGSLTAGRQNYNNALLPYDTDDKIHTASEITGPKTIIRVANGGKVHLWEPFSDYYRGFFTIKRNLYKNTAGNKVIFEEINEDLQMIFRYCWMSSDELGWIRKSTLINVSDNNKEAEITDGLLNILPYGITRELQAMLSTLMDAYKVAQWLPEHHMALFYMSSIPVDRAEPSEALRTNVAWCHGLNIQNALLSPAQLHNLRKGKPLRTENKIFGERNAFLADSKMLLKAYKKHSWYMVADVALDSADVAALQHLIKNQNNLSAYIENSIEQSNQKLNELVRLSDGIQKTSDPLNDRRHYANIMFNIMRGGLFESNYEINVSDFLEHLENANKEIYKEFRPLYQNLNSSVKLDDLLKFAQEHADLKRITLEYLPLSFSRRHGDPSRPWNFFDIKVKNPDGTPSLNYQGNWRDIFQNWEALAMSFPGFLPGMICRFLNASTADGYNPYRITRQGFDWEVPEPDNPWAFIGYWGDHQIIYLLRLLEMHEKFYPGKLLENLKGQMFVYARVPYRIKNYAQICENPQDTIVFDHELHEQLMQKSRENGADGKLMYLDGVNLARATFMEKLLVSMLAKLSNFVPEAGIWLNTQRPEWNDANNALVGNGASMVTLYHLRRFVTFLITITGARDETGFTVAEEVIQFKNHIEEVLLAYSHLLDKGFDDIERKSITDRLGKAGEDYREKTYNGFSGKSSAVEQNRLLEFLHLIRSFLDQSIIANQREDGLYHSYNLLKLDNQAIGVKHLDLMLEGQVALLNSGLPDHQQTSEIIQALFESDLWREDQLSFMLYPFRKLPGFTERNIIPSELVEKSKLLSGMIAKNDTRIVKIDINKQYHFNADFNSARELKEALQKIKDSYDYQLIEKETPDILNVYETVFNHKSFTGRSGSFYKYEGLGSIYWHMVSKLLLALGENIITFEKNGIDRNVLNQLKSYYYKVKTGIGIHKKPDQYGAFPTDPYSHTPSMMGAQQPGLTGQVKEDILSRFLELGLWIDNGRITILPALMKEAQPNTSEFSFCNTRFVVKNTQKKEIIIFRKNQKPVTVSSNSIPEDISMEIFNRTGTIEQVVCNI